MRRSTATCAASFWPKNALSGATMWKSFATTVATPRKCPGRDAPSRRLADAFHLDEGVAPRRIHLLGLRSEDQRDAFGLQQRAVLLKGAWIFREVLVGAELRRVDEDGRRDHVALRPR